MSYKITRKFHIERERIVRIHRGNKPKRPTGRIPRISRLMALAIYFDNMMRNGEVSDMATLAQLGHVSRARMTQIMNLLMLASDIQEQILFLPKMANGRGNISEREIRNIAATINWYRQRNAWHKLLNYTPKG